MNLYFQRLGLNGFLMPELFIKYRINRANSYNPDVIVGYYVKKRNSSDELRIVWKYLNELYAKEGVYFVNEIMITEVAEKIALEFLENGKNSIRHKHKIIQRGNIHMVIAGAGDF